jgi:hypothetical protein
MKREPNNFYKSLLYHSKNEVLELVAYINISGRPSRRKRESTGPWA